MKKLNYIEIAGGARLHISGKNQLAIQTGSQQTSFLLENILHPELALVGRMRSGVYFFVRRDYTEPMTLKFLDGLVSDPVCGKTLEEIGFGKLHATYGDVKFKFAINEFSKEDTGRYFERRKLTYPLKLHERMCSNPDPKSWNQPSTEELLDVMNCSASLVLFCMQWPGEGRAVEFFTNEDFWEMREIIQKEMEMLGIDPEICCNARVKCSLVEKAIKKAAGKMHPFAAVRMLTEEDYLSAI